MGEAKADHSLVQRIALAANQPVVVGVDLDVFEVDTLGLAEFAKTPAQPARLLHRYRFVRAPMQQQQRNRQGGAGGQHIARPIRFRRGAQPT